MAEHVCAADKFSTCSDCRSYDYDYQEAAGKLMDLVLAFEESAYKALEDVSNEDLQAMAVEYGRSEGSLGANMWATAKAVLVRRRVDVLAKLMPEGTTMMSFHELMTIEEKTKGNA